MRLLNAQTLEFAEFFDNSVPKYYILSHRWSTDETSYKEFVKGRGKSTIGYQKIVDFCKWALAQAARVHKRETRFIPLDHRPAAPSECWVWIDTCCIDKKSSAELSFAINSMYQWYDRAFLCCVYLADVTSEHQIIESEWFKRGWTLQELLAPRKMVFVNSNWKLLGHRCRVSKWYAEYWGDEALCNLHPCDVRIWAPSPDLNCDIEAATGIPVKYLKISEEIEAASVAQRLSWASKRQTTRVEDEAYCLMGLLNVNMPLLYGEGRKAFGRLQEQIIKESNDHSIFAWYLPSEQHECSPVLARSPKDFINSGNIGKSTGSVWPYSVTNSGLPLRHMARKLCTEDETLLFTHKAPSFVLLLDSYDESAGPDDNQMYLIIEQHGAWREGNQNPQKFVRWQLCTGQTGLKNLGYKAYGELELREFLLVTDVVL